MSSVRAREHRRPSSARAPERAAERLVASTERAGEPLPTAARSTMERAFSHSFADVRVHVDAASDALACEHGARALTIGNDIFFRGDSAAPNDVSDPTLLAHELAHVVQFQQAGEGRSQGDVTQRELGGRLTTTDHAEGAEVEARTAARAVVSGEAPSITNVPSAAVARDDDDPKGPSFSLIPPKLNYGFGVGGGNANLSLGAGGLGADYSRGLFHGDASVGFGGSASLNLGVGAPLMPWIGDVNRDLGGAAGGVNSLMNGGGLTSSNLSALGGFSALGDIADAGKPARSPWGVGLQLSHSDDENRAMLGARFDF